MTGKTLALFAVSAGLVLAAAACARPPRTVAVGVRADEGNVRLFSVVETRRYYRVPRAQYCEADGIFLYCWPATYRNARRVVVHVYERPAEERGHPGRGHAYGRWKQEQRERARVRAQAIRAYRSWYADRGYRDRDRLEIRVTW